MTLKEAVGRAKRNCLILQEFLTDTQIESHLLDIRDAENATDYTTAMIDEAIVNMLQAILPVAPKEYKRGNITVTRESVKETLHEYQKKTGMGTVNLYRGDSTTWNDKDNE